MQGVSLLIIICSLAARTSLSKGQFFWYFFTLKKYGGIMHVNGFPPEFIPACRGPGNDDRRSGNDENRGQNDREKRVQKMKKRGYNFALKKTLKISMLRALKNSKKTGLLDWYPGPEIW
jgi:hypothetical protein